MKLRKVVKIDDLEVTIKELTVAELLYLCHRTGWVTLSGEFKQDSFKKYDSQKIWDVSLSFVSDAKKMDMIKLAPSEIEKLYEAFMEVNATIVSTFKYLGIDKMLQDLKKNLMKHFMDEYGALIKG